MLEKDTNILEQGVAHAILKNYLNLEKQLRKKDARNRSTVKRRDVLLKLFRKKKNAKQFK